LVATAKALKLLPLPEGKRESLVMLLAGGLTYLLPMAMLFMQIDLAFDRYLIFLLPLGIAIVTLLVGNVVPDNAGSLLRTLAVASLLLYGAFSIAGTHDYLSWNRARWQALNNLTAEQRITADVIDGGFEFNAWYSYDSKYLPTKRRSWWWVFRDDFMVTFGPVPEFAEVRRYPFRRWLPPGEGNILVLQRTPSNDLR
jgi:hypothetical protein